MKAMVIGAAGFVGPYLIRQIQDDLHCDVIATKLPHETVDVENATIVDLDILDVDSVYKILMEERPKYIFHLAAQSSVALAWKDPALTVNINIKGALNILNAIRQINYNPKVLMVGSGEEYGQIKESKPITEDTELNPGNIYAITKATQNMMASIYAAAYNMNIVLVRAFNHIGPGQSPQFVVSDFCKQVVSIELGITEPVMKVGNLVAKRDFTDVRDVVRAYTALIQFGRPGETYNVGSGKAITIESVLHAIIKQSESDIIIEIDPAKIRPVDVPMIEADITKLYDATGWKPVYKLEQTIADTLNYWRDALKE